jgi:hypothetical protein
MARKNTNEELWTVVSQFGILRDATAGTPGDTTTDAAASAGDALVSVVSETNFTAGDWIRIDGGNKMEVQQVLSTAAGQLNLEDELAFAHLSGVAVKELLRVDIGDITDDGVVRDTEVETAEVRAATTAQKYAELVTNVSGQVSANLLNHSPENLLASLGIAETELRGTGTTADPWIADLTFDSVGTVINEAVYFTGALNDGTTVEIQGWGAEWEGTQSVTYVRGGTVSLPIVADVKHFRYYVPAP